MAAKHLLALALALALGPSGAQISGGNWTVPVSLNEYRANDKTTRTFGSHVDVNGDGLPDIVVQASQFGGSSVSVQLATYLNTGNSYCIAFENDNAKRHRAEGGAIDIPSCSDVPSMAMHEPNEDKRVTAFLASIKLGEYAPAFAEHKVDYETLLNLHHGHLKEMGIKAVGARLKIIQAAARARRSAKARLGNNSNPQSPSGIQTDHNLNCPPSTDSYQLPGNAASGAWDIDSALPMNVRDSGNGHTVLPLGVFQDINGDGLPDLIFSTQDEDQGGTGVKHWNRRCTYLNTGTSWELV